MINSTAITFVVIYVLEAVFIIIGNSFAIFVFWKQKLNQKRTCVLLINLAVADLLVGIAEPIVLTTGKFSKMTAVRGREKQTENPSAPLQLFASSTSVCFLALISLERVYAVLWPLRHRATETRVYIYSIVIIWVVGLCTGGLTLSSMYNAKVDRRYVIAVVHSCLFIALLVICASYLKIRNRLRSTSPDITFHKNRSTEHNLRLSRTLFIVVAVSLVFWLPAFVVYTVSEFCRQCFSPSVSFLVNALHLANSLVNSFVYIFRMPIFKDALKKFRRKRRQNVKVRLEAGGGNLGSAGSFTPLGMKRRNHTSDMPSHSSADSNVKIHTVFDDGFQLDNCTERKEEHRSPPTPRLLKVKHVNNLDPLFADRIQDH